jgi:hypothetical protein
MDIADLTALAHREAKAGNTETARQLIRQLEDTGRRNDDIRKAIGFLHYLTGDARSSLRFLLEIRNHDSVSLMALSCAYSAMGERKKAAAVSAASKKLPSDLCFEDSLQFDSIQGFKIPENAHCGWGEHIRRLAVGDFEGAQAGMLKLSSILPAFAPGALTVRLRSGKRLRLWRGEPVNTLVAMFCDGFGDTFCMGRYISGLKSKAKTVIAVLPKTTIPLISKNLYGIKIAPLDDCSEALNSADAYANEWYMPSQSGEGFGKAHWLQVDELDIEQWRPRPDGNLHIGICWGGSNWNLLRARKIPVDMLQPLFSIPGVTWHSLQIGAQASERPASCIDYTTRIRNWSDTAALMSALDLVVSVDTSISNLAGALARPLWLLAHDDPDFRWCGGGPESTPWFPSARVFRQDQGGWESVVSRVRDALRARLANLETVPETRIAVPTT